VKQILWFRRDLRLEDNAILHHAHGEVLPVFIFDKNILDPLHKEDKRVTFIYQSVIKLKKQLQAKGLDLAIFYDTPCSVFMKLKKQGFDEVLCSCDFDSYAIKRDKEIEKILPLKRFYDSFLLHPTTHLKKDGTPYKVFTPFFKSLEFLWQSDYIEPYKCNVNLKAAKFDYDTTISLQTLGFKQAVLPEFLHQDAFEVLEAFKTKIDAYETNRDIFYLNATSNLSVYLRFGLISSKQIFNEVRKLRPSNGVECFIKELFWREFYNYILFHFPQSEFENFNALEVQCEENDEHFKKWCEGQTGVPLIDAAMQHLNNTGLMHNRLRMVVASYATKNLLLPWQWGEEYFAQKLLDYEASSNVGSWQWAASTGADSVPYFRVFNPYLQSKKFDKQAVFIKKVMPFLENIDAKVLHIENAIQQNLFVNYPKQLVGIDFSRKRVIMRFKELKN
jgi:deoxyribodipyrimidine photo-lyase